jgi:signal transduction histidine kinase
MLHDFIVANRDVIIDRARQQVRDRMPAHVANGTVEYGVPLFLTQLVEGLKQATVANGLRIVRAEDSAKIIHDSAELHGVELLKQGFTVAQVVHGYGDVCQIVTALALEAHAPIAADDFHVFNRCLDDAIAGAVTAYGKRREEDLAYEGTERQGVLAHELRNLLHAATLSYDVIKRGTVGLGGSTGAMLARSLSGLTALVEASLAEVRLESGTPRLEHMLMAGFIEEIEVGAAMHADGNGLILTVAPVKSDLAVAVDRQLLASALSNLLQNAFKFTRAGGHVSLITRATPTRVLIDVCDECGGLPAGTAEELFRPFSQASKDRSGLGLGLTIALRAARACAGDISVRDIPGTGCVFTIDLPRQTTPQSPVRHLRPKGDSSPPGDSAVDAGSGSQAGGTPRSSHLTSIVALRRSCG